MNKEINNWIDLREWFAEQIICIDVSCYKNDFETIVKEGADIFLIFIKDEYNFKYGDKIPEQVTSNDIFECIEDL